MTVKRLLVAGTHSGSGKTTTAIGLMAALAGRGLRVQPFKVGPDYIDTAYHTLASGWPSRNLDDWMLPLSTLRHLFCRSACQADIALVEGVMGLYDGIGSGSQGSTAAVAKTINAPVVLVVDTAGMSTSAAAQVLGYQRFDPGLDLRGVILNRAYPGRHYESMKEAIERAAGVAVLGCLPPDREVSLPSRHLGLVPSAEMAGIRGRLERLVHLIENHIDLELLCKIASDAAPLKEDDSPLSNFPAGGPPRVKLAVARDSAFNFYYQDSLDLLSDLGAEIEFFSPLEDSCVPPDADGLYLGGGFPEVFADELARNRPMLESLRRRLHEGLPCYAECGGLMYLTGSIAELEGENRPMVGFLGGASRMTAGLQRFGYVEIEFTMPNILGCPGEKIRGHEFHHSVVEGVDAPGSYRVTSALKEKDWTCGFVRNNVLAGYPHIHFWSNPKMAANLVKSCRRYRKEVRMIDC